MRNVKVFLVAFSVFTYGSEVLDTLATQSEWDRFSMQLQCHVIEDHVWCKLDDGSYATIENQPINVPWGIS